MSLIVHRATRPEALAERLAELLAEPPADPFAVDQVAVHSGGLEQWLAMQVAQHNGICSAVAFPTPTALVAQLSATALGEPPEGLHGWGAGALLWALLAELPPLLDQGVMAPVRDYVDAEGPSERSLRLTTLCQRLARVFQAYGTYRADLVHAWQAPTSDEPWEAPLWRAVEARVGAVHVVGWSDRLGAAPTLPEGLGRLALFGVSTLPPLLLDVAARLAGDHDIHVFLLHPSPRLWSRPGAQHPLLDSMGELIRDVQHAVGACDGVEHDVIDSTPGPRDSLLHALQADLHDDELRAYAEADRSVQVHVCTSPLRQVHALRDALLDLFRANQDLELRDVVVMSPDVETFAPLVQAVFADGARAWSAADAHPAGFPALPFRLADRGARAENLAAEALLRLLDLVDGRLEAPAVLELLALEPVRERFGIEADALPAVRKLVIEGGARWGRDAEHRAQQDLPADDRFTWRFALDRLLVGQSLAAPEATSLYGLAPSGGIEGKNERHLLGGLADFAETLLAETASLGGARPPEAWFGDLARSLDGLLADHTPRSWQKGQVLDVLRELAEHAQAAGVTEDVDLRTVRALLGERFGLREPGQGFLAGTITVCELVPLRSVPFEVVCLLGIDDGQFPRVPSRPGYDRMAHARRPGDRDASVDDRALFLEAIQSARDTLVVTCTGRSERTGRDLPLAVPVAELLDVVRSMTDDATVERLQHRHALQPWSPEHFTAPAKSHDRRMLAAARAWLDGRTAPTELPRRFTGPLPGKADIPNELSLDHFVRFWRHPPSELVRRRLGLSLWEDEVELSAEIPFDLDGLGRWKLRHALLADDSPVPYRDRALRSGMLPLGTPGRVALEDQEAQVQAFRVQVAPLLADPRAPVDVHLPGEPTLSGRLHDLYAGGRVVLQPGRVKPKGLFQLWIEHLALHASGWSGTSTLLGPSGGSRLRPMAADKAAAQLDRLRNGYRKGLAQPLLFWPDVSLDACRADDRAEARRASRDAWKNRSDAVRTVDTWVLGPGTHPFDDDAGIPGLADPLKVAKVWTLVLPLVEEVSL